MTDDAEPALRVLVKEAARVAVLAGDEEAPGKASSARTSSLRSSSTASVDAAPIAVRADGPIQIGDEAGDSAHPLRSRRSSWPGSRSMSLMRNPITSRPDLLHQRPGVVDLLSVSRISSCGRRNGAVQPLVRTRSCRRGVDVAVEDEPMISPSLLMAGLPEFPPTMSRSLEKVSSVSPSSAPSSFRSSSSAGERVFPVARS